MIQCNNLLAAHSQRYLYNLTFYFSVIQVAYCALCALGVLKQHESLPCRSIMSVPQNLAAMNAAELAEDLRELILSDLVV